MVKSRVNGNIYELYSGGNTCTYKYHVQNYCRCQSKACPTTFPGQKDFKGTVIHSSEYRIPEVYSGRTVLIVGSRPSAWDITLDVVKHAKQVGDCLLDLSL